MTVAELIRKLQSLDVDPDAPINFFVNIFNAAEVDEIKMTEYARNFGVRKEVDFYLQSDDLED